tara:strand:+ start:370 stop:555 length:186 start_codon:yes stop_codon:yes gene_type:complete
MIDFLSALGLVFVIEGLLLFILPFRVQELLKLISSYSEKKIRLTGLFSIIIGVIVIGLIRL